MFNPDFYPTPPEVAALITHPHLDYAIHGNRRWAWAAGCWREWSNIHADWLPSNPPPAEAAHSNYRTLLLQRRP